MSKDQLYNINLGSPVQITREDYTHLGSDVHTVGTIPRAFLAVDFEIWTASSGGTQLALNTDYELVDKDQAYSTRAGQDVYKSFRIINATYQSCALYITYKCIGSYPTAELLGGILSRDLLINGNMRWWQRGTSFTNPANVVYTADRWYVRKSSGSGTLPDVDIDRVIGSTTDNYYMKLTVTSNASSGTGMYWRLCQKYEFYDGLKGQTVSIRARVKVDNGVKFRIYLYDGVNSNSIVFTGTGDWQEVTHTATISASATNFEVLYALANETYEIPESGDIHYIERIQVNIGNNALPFVPYDSVLDLEKCLRYYWRGYAAGFGLGHLYANTTQINVLANSTSFSVEMRVDPTMGIVTAPTYVNCTHQSVPASKRGFLHRVDATGGWYRAYNGVYEADAEL